MYTLLKKLVFFVFYFNSGKPEMQKQCIFLSHLLQHCWFAVILNDIKHF